MRNKIFGVLAAIALLFIIFFIYKGCGKTPAKPEIISVKTQSEVVDKFEIAAMEENARLRDQIKLDSIVAGGLKTKITNLRYNAKVMEGIINDLQNDTSAADEYKQTVQEYVLNSKEKDTACDNLVANLTVQISGKDSLILMRDTLYSNLRKSFKTALTQQATMEKYGKDMRRTLLKKKVGNIVWKSAAIVAGLYILKSFINER